VSTSSLTPEELRAAAEVHSELGPGYQDAVVESFMEKVDREIEARVDARLADMGRGRRGAARPARDHSFSLAVISLVFGIPISAIVLGHGSNLVDLVGLIVVWFAIVAINVANGLHNTRSRGR
jgi:hypothetical protein